MNWNHGMLEIISGPMKSAKTLELIFRLKKLDYSNVDYQLLVNRRYASAWLDILYDEGSHLYGSEVPDIHRFNLYSSKDEMKQAMGKVLDKIMFDAKGSDFFKR